MKRTFLFFLLLVSFARAANWYVDAAATGSGNGTSWANAWTTFAAITQASLAGGDTVYIKSGTYNEQYTITKSGASSSARITYLGSGPTKPVIQKGFYAINVDYIGVINIEFTQPVTTYLFSSIYCLGNSTLGNGCDGWLIQDNYIHDTAFGGIDQHNGTHNNNIIRCNRLSNIGGTSGGAGQGGTVVQISGNYNLAEYNIIDTSLDRFVVGGTSTGSIIRNNYYSGTNTTLYPNTSPYPFHTDGVQPYSGTNQVLYERNWDKDNRDSAVAGTPNGHAAILQINTGSADWAIVRFNVWIREAESGLLFKAFNSAYVYNLTGVAIGIDQTSNFNSCGAGWQTPQANLCDFRNNTWDFMPHSLAPTGIVSSNNNPTNFTTGTQHSYNTGTQGVLNPATGTANLGHVDPLFVDGTGVSGHDDYHLQNSSPLKTAGSAFAVAVGSGTTSTSLTVTAPKGFSDGWGIADADWIKIGSGAYVQISSVNTSTGVITLSAARSWSDTDAVIVKGMEDIGALPYSYAVPFTLNLDNTYLPAGAVTFTATIDHPEAVRKVEYLVDSMPVGTSYTAPYSVGYVADGNPHTVETRACKLYANISPTQSQIVVLTSAVAPVITLSPVSQTALEGTNVVFTATATGSPTPTWQWNKNASPIGGATSSTLTLTAITVGDAGSYTATATNASGSATSSAAVLTVTAVDPGTIVPETPIIIGVAP